MRRDYGEDLLPGINSHPRLLILLWIEFQVNSLEYTGEAGLAKDGKERSKEELFCLQETLDRRHYWILGQLADGGQITRQQVQEKFGHSVRTAKRMLRVLTSCGLIQFDRAQAPGHYRLCGRTSDVNQILEQARECSVVSDSSRADLIQSRHTPPAAPSVRSVWR